jgi:3-dehydro-L-gulonate 2-dehydrogenase
MRGGSYGWHAAQRGVGLLAWTNTTPNLPPWGSAVPRVGNNPLVVAIPHGHTPVVLDMAMSQFSYGRLEVAALRREALPVPGGFDRDGQLTTDPAEILASQRPLPVGHWKGGGLALVLDLLAATLSGGRSTVEIGRQREESGLSQVFVAFDVQGRVGAHASSVLTTVLDDLVRTPPIDPATPVRHPGEQVLRLRRENLRLGVPVDAGVWAEIRAI